MVIPTFLFKFSSIVNHNNVFKGMNFEINKKIARSLREDFGGSFDDNNPFIVAKSFLKKHPNLASDPKSSQNLININLINSILSQHINNFYIT